MLTLGVLEELWQPRGQQALTAAGARELQPRTLLADLEALRVIYGAELATAAVETVRLRRQARPKFSRAARMYFTREALEQATAEAVALHRAARYAGHEHVWDLCCGIGGDLIALAGKSRVTGIDLDPLRLRMADCNAAAYGVRDRASFVQADVAGWQPSPHALIFWDPGRRHGARRVFDPKRYQPPLRTLERWLSSADGIGVKVAPGIDYDALPWECEVEVVSLGGEVKEAVLWLGQLQRGKRTATVLPEGATLIGSAVAPVGVERPHSYLYEPDGAVIRAHLVEHLAHAIGATKIDQEIAFLSSDALVATPFARAFRIEEVLPFNLKRLRSHLRERKIGHVVVKKRGSPIDPQALEKELRLEGHGAATIVLTHVLGKPSALICDVTD